MKKKVYQIVNIVIILMVSALFVKQDIVVPVQIKCASPVLWISLIAIAVAVYTIKAVRLYFIMLGQGISAKQFLKQYCKVIPVSVVVPYKLGELFRIYCYGYQIGNYWNSTVIILLDRFVDTIALVCVLLGFTVYKKMAISGIVYLLIVFLMVVVIAYMIFPELCRYWKKYFLARPASKRGIAVLELLEMAKEAYMRIQSIAKGKYVILFAFSLLAWGIEIGGIGLLGGDVLAYLTSALTGSDNGLLQQYVIVSVLLMMIVYIILHGYMWICEWRTHKC